MNEIKLLSEQLPNDGSFHLPNLLTACNKRLQELGKRGKRAKLKVSGDNLAAQFSFNGKQEQKGLNLRFTKKGITEGEKLAELITAQLVANQFTWEWFDGLLGKQKLDEKEKALSCQQMLENFKIRYFKDNQHLKSVEESWKICYSKIEKVLATKKDCLSLPIVREIIECTNNNSWNRRNTLNGITNLLEYFDIKEFDNVIAQYKKNNKIKRKPKNIPSDIEIISIYNTGFKIPIKCAKKHAHRYSQWQFLYSLLAVYGLRIHEAWNIANWDKPVTFRNGDWVAIIDESDKNYETQYQGKNQVIPAILDPNNDKHILCVKHDTKTGYRMALPISPEGCDWIKEFNLLQPFNLPNINSKKRRVTERNCTPTNSSCSWFRRHNYGFTPHALRHAYNHRAHNLGYNPKDIANSLGHTLATNQSIYLRNESIGEKYRTLKLASNKNLEKQSKVKNLEIENQRLKEENKQLQTMLKMYQAIGSEIN